MRQGVSVKKIRSTIFIINISSLWITLFTIIHRKFNFFSQTALLVINKTFYVWEYGPFDVRSSSRNSTELLSKGRIFAQYFDLTAYTPFFLAWHFSSEKIAVFPIYSVLFLIFFLIYSSENLGTMYLVKMKNLRVMVHKGW